ncbi:MAG: hypothetical protein WCL11_00540 [Verrucomicrobiota bacterium]
METIIALPLLFLLIGGAMWEGQLIYDKQKMVIADRYLAWNWGNRWSQDKNVSEAVQKFFPDKEHDAVTVVIPGNGHVAGWTQEARAGMSITATMPVWTRGWFDAEAVAYQDSTPPRSVVLHGRDLGGASGEYRGHIVIMRTGNPDTRTDPVTPEDNSINRLGLSKLYDF